MERTFMTHEIRKSQEICGLWDFYPAISPDEKRRVTVPSCWETYPGLESYQGMGIYEKELYLDGRVRFLFKGVSHTAQVYLDGKLIARHYNAYTPFEAEAEAAPGMHTLRVEVDNSFNEESALHVPNDYYTYGGITRPVIVESVGDLSIGKLHFTPYTRDEKWYARISAEIKNSRTEAVGVTLKVFLGEETCAEFCLAVPAGKSVLQQDTAFPNAVSYEPDKPILYRLQAVLYIDGEPVDDLIDRVGFREIKINGTDILYNGNKLKIRGFNRHEDHGQFGCAIPVEAMAADLRLIMDTGANAVRTCHYPNDERFLDLCDELGLLVWEEAHARGLSEEQMRHRNFRRQSLDCIDEMVENHYNHPCIFTWGILNECASMTKYGREVYSEQFERIRSLDTSRPLTFASCHIDKDICLDLPDIVSMNIYPLWYIDESPEAFLDHVYRWVQETPGKGKPFIISEIGAGAIYGCHASHNPKWSEERQAQILKEQLTAVLSHEKTSGVFIWQFCDCRMSEEWFARRPRGMNNKGIVDEYRRKKMAYETVKEIYHQM